MKHSGQCLTTFSNTSKFVKNTPLRVIFSTLLSVYGNVVKHGLSCLMYYESCFRIGLYLCYLSEHFQCEVLT